MKKIALLFLIVLPVFAPSYAFGEDDLSTHSLIKPVASWSGQERVSLVSLAANTATESATQKTGMFGKEVCKIVSGKIRNPYDKSDYHYATFDAYYEALVTGVIENSSESKLQIRISKIYEMGQHGGLIESTVSRGVYLNGDDVSYKVGSIIWVESSKWQVCEK